MELNKSRLRSSCVLWQNDVAGLERRLRYSVSRRISAWKAPDVPPVTSATGI